MRRTESDSSGLRDGWLVRVRRPQERWKRFATSLFGPSTTFLTTTFLITSMTIMTMAFGAMALEVERPAASTSDSEASTWPRQSLADAGVEQGQPVERVEPVERVDRSDGVDAMAEVGSGREQGAARDARGAGEPTLATRPQEPREPQEPQEAAAEKAVEREDAEDAEVARDEPDSEQQRVQSEIDSLVSEFLATSDAVANRPDGMRPVAFTGPEERPDWYQALVVTNKENPLLEEECKKEALNISVETLREAHGIEEEAAALQQAAHHMREHQDFAASHAISYADYLHEIASCRAFCAPLVAHLVRCQVLAVSHSPHGIVLFDLDSDQVDPRYERGLVDEAVATLKKDPRSRVLLAGRASKIGDLRYNRRLSARRALAVRDKLIERGAPADRIKTMWFGWEPPQISSWIASRYGFDSLYVREGGHRMNQSVMLVIYSGSEDVEEKNDETVAESVEDEDVLSTAQLSAP